MTQRTAVNDRVAVNPVAMLGFSIDEEIAALVEMGAHRIGVCSAKLGEGDWTSAVGRYQAAGLEVAYLLHPVYAAVDDDDAWASESTLLVQTVDTAAAVGARYVYFPSGTIGSGSATWEEAVELLGHRLAPAIERSAATGVALALENTVSTRTDCSFVFSLRDAVVVARQLGIMVCADLFGCWLEPGLAQTFREHMNMIETVQVSDRDLRSPIHPDRRVPGDADLPLERLVTEILDAGFDGLFDIELLGPRIEAEGPGVAMGRAVTWVSDLLDRTTSSAA